MLRRKKTVRTSQLQCVRKKSVSVHATRKKIVSGFHAKAHDGVNSHWCAITNPCKCRCEKWLSTGVQPFTNVNKYDQRTRVTGPFNLHWSHLDPVLPTQQQRCKWISKVMGFLTRMLLAAPLSKAWYVSLTLVLQFSSEFAICNFAAFWRLIIVSRHLPLVSGLNRTPILSLCSTHACRVKVCNPFSLQRASVSVLM